MADNHSVDIYTDMDLLTSKASNIYPATTLVVELANDAHFTLHNRLLAGDLDICSTVENNHKNQLATFERDVDLHGNLNIRDTNASFNGSITFLDEIKDNSQYHGIPAITISGNSNVIINRANITNSIHGKLQNTSTYFTNNRAAIILTNSDQLINDQEEDNRPANISFEYDTINIDNVTTAEGWDTKPTSLSGFLVKAQWKSPDLKIQDFVVNINGTNLIISNVKPKISDFGAVDDERKRSISLWYKQTPGIPGVDFYLKRL